MLTRSLGSFVLALSVIGCGIDDHPGTGAVALEGDSTGDGQAAEIIELSQVPPSAELPTFQAGAWDTDRDESGPHLGCSRVPYTAFFPSGPPPTMQPGVQSGGPIGFAGSGGMLSLNWDTQTAMFQSPDVLGFKAVAGEELQITYGGRNVGAITVPAPLALETPACVNGCTITPHRDLVVTWSGGGAGWAHISLQQGSGDPGGEASPLSTLDCYFAASAHTATIAQSDLEWFGTLNGGPSTTLELEAINRRTFDVPVGSGKVHYVVLFHQAGILPGTNRVDIVYPDLK
jgi:hypothetical protein